MNPRQTTAMRVSALVQVPDASDELGDFSGRSVAAVRVGSAPSARTLVHRRGTVGCADDDEANVVAR